MTSVFEKNQGKPTCVLVLCKFLLLHLPEPMGLLQLQVLVW